jgi:hypothetical protein
LTPPRFLFIAPWLTLKDGRNILAREFSEKTMKGRLKMYIQGIAGRDVADIVRKRDAFAMDGPCLEMDSEHLRPADSAP